MDVNFTICSITRKMETKSLDINEKILINKFVDACENRRNIWN